MIRNKIIAAISTGTLALGLALLGGAAAHANGETTLVDDLETPDNSAKLHAIIHWTSNEVVTFSNTESYTKDLLADGHGPYAHIFAEYPNVAQQFVSSHNTGGVGHVQYFGGINNIAGPVDHIDVWICNGGNSLGGGADSCHGRRYFNPAQGNYSPSENLGYGIPY